MLIIKEIIAIVEPISTNVIREVSISSIHYDSRKCDLNTLFIAIPGYSSDGHDFIQKAIENGASVIIGEKELPFENYIRVKNSREALAKVAFKFYGDPQKSLKIFGVTGTNGKTTTVHLLKAILDETDEKTAMIGTNGIVIGDEVHPATHTTPESLELAQLLARIRDEGCKNVVMEVSSHALHQGRVQMIDFKGAIFTNITQDHLDYHKTMDEYIKAKKILFDGLKEDSVAVLNGDDPNCKNMIKDCRAQAFILRTKIPEDINTNNFLIEDIKLDLSGISYIIRKGTDKISIKSPLMGMFNVHNSALAASLLLRLQYPEEIVFRGLAKSEGADGRMQKISLPNGALALVDYAHTPDGLDKALSAAKEIIRSNGKGSLISVFGCGGDRDKGKRPQMGHISSSIADHTIVTSDNPRTEDPSQIIRDIINGISSTYEVIQDRRAAIRKAIAISSKNDIILIAGKGHENYQIIGTEKFHFDDAEEVKRMIQQEN